MTTKVTGKNMVSIPVAMARHFGIRPGYEFDWKPSRHPEEMIVRVIPDPRGLSRRLRGAGAKAGGRRSAVVGVMVCLAANRSRGGLTIFYVGLLAWSVALAWRGPDRKLGLVLLVAVS